MDRRVVVVVVALATAGLWVAAEAETRRLHAYGLLLLVCAGMASSALVAHNLRWINLLRRVGQEVVLTEREARYRSGHVHHALQWAEITRIEIRAKPGAPSVLVLLGDKASCPVPQASWEALGMLKRLRRLDGLDEHQIRRALHGATAQAHVVWAGPEGAAAALGRDG